MSKDTDTASPGPGGNDAEHLAIELAAARNELEVFCYSVSHDLRAPLRAVDGFSRILLEDYAEQLDDDGRRMLGVIRTEAQRMGRLIDAMLVFSRLGRQEMEIETIDMHEMARTVFDELAAHEAGRKLKLNLHPLPAACGSRPMIRQVWENLIGNAIKFTKGREIAEIEIGMDEGNDGVPTYYISDNGAGFDMRLAEKLFGIFQRFHSEEEFPGIGLGLALVQRIIHRHGGLIRAEAQVGEGATFHFTLPHPKP
jgi:two-component system sensor kinase